jgi:hypothetical protein
MGATQVNDHRERDSYAVCPATAKEVVMQHAAQSTLNTPTQERKELSGPDWARRFIGSKKTSDLKGNFRLAVEEFVQAMMDAGMKVSISATYRPIKRSYLMHWSWRIGKGRVEPENVPALAGVDIEWVHSTKAESVSAARALMSAFDIASLPITPALRSQHNLGLAIDMSISWRGVVSIKDATGSIVKINTLPRSGMNRQLIKVGQSYGVRKYSGGGSDAPHWSNNGR